MLKFLQSLSQKNKILLAGTVALIALILLIISGGDASKDETSDDVKLVVQSKEDDPKYDKVRSRGPSRVQPEGYEGEIFAGKEAPYVAFNEKDYNRALKEGKIIVFNFCADWDGLCREEERFIKRGFSMLGNSRIVAFKVNYKDDNTDDLERSLAEKHGVGVSHVKVIVKNGEQIYKKTETWETMDVLEILSKLE
ncbi:TlpA family protein disulfide reductase [Patescibacteria group bacterium]